MKKKILIGAVAAAMATPMVASAEAIIYGKLHLSLDNVNYENGTDGYCKEPGLKGWDVCSRASRLGFKGSEDLGSGLKAIWKLEFGVQMADGDNNAVSEGNPVSSGRDMYVGLAGDWGTALIGRHDTPHKMATARQDVFSDTLADYNFTANLVDIRADNAIAYISPNWGGFTLAGAIVASGTATTGLGNNTNADSLTEAWSIAAMYSNGPFFAALSYEEWGDEMLMSQATSDGPSALQPDSLSQWKVGLGYKVDMFEANLIYEDQEDRQNIWHLNGKFNFGNNAVKASYSNLDGDTRAGDADGDAWAIGLDHNFSKRTTAYLLYADKNMDRGKLGDWHGFSLGMIHNF